MRTTLLAGFAALALAMLGASVWSHRGDSSAPPRAALAVLPAALSLEPWRADESAVVVARRLREAKDNRAFYDRALETGGGTHLHMALEAVTQCAWVNGSSAALAEQRMGAWLKGQPHFERRMRAVRAMIAPCRAFEARPVSNAEISELRKLVAGEPDAMGQAHALGRSGHSRGEREAVAMARQLIATGDPHVIRLVARDLHRRGALDTEMSAWNWALCDLGFDCDPESYLGLAACVAGECEWAHIDEAGSRLFAHSGGWVRRERKEEIVAALRKGDWKTLGL